MTTPITLDGLAPVEESPADCVVAYPGETPGSSVLVSYDHDGAVRERVGPTRATKGLVRRMLLRLVLP